MTIATGTRLGPYEIVAALGAGGMGEVYRARDTRLERTVAIKIVATAAAHDPRLRERFEHEARSVAALNHPNICTLYDVGRHLDLDYIVMEYLEGETLADRLAASGPLGVDASLAIAIQILDALDAAHSRGIVHRDLKPGNIFLVRTADARTPLAKLLDFGLAKACGMEHAALTAALPVTETGLIVGTVAYMSPEQAEARPVDARSDLFSFGAVLYEMLTGRRAFEGTSAAATLVAVLQADPPPVAQLRPGVPPAVASVVAGLLAKDPRARLASAGDTKRALTAASSKPATTPAARPAPGPPLVAVLPFTNLSHEPDTEYFAEGLAEEIGADLSAIRALRVLSRASAMRFKEADRDLPSLARELGVRYVLTGSVRRAASSLRVTAQLVDAEQDAHLWAEKYSGTLDDVFAIQEEISRRIVDALKVQLTTSEDRQIAARPILDPRAYDCYLRARQHLYAFTPDSLQRAEAYVRGALAIVGENALLHATEGFIHWMYVNSGVEPDETRLARAAECARRALALDPDSYQAIFVRGIVAALSGRLEEGVKDLVSAYERSPSDTNVLTELWRFLFDAGQEDAYGRIGAALFRIDPFTPISGLCEVCGHLAAGNPDAAVAAGRRVLPFVEPMSLIQVVVAWQPLLPGGHRDEARRMLEQYATRATDDTFRSLARFLACAIDGDREAAHAHMTPGVQRTVERQEHFARFVAEAYAQLGDHDEALHWLRVSVERGLIHYPFLAHHDVLLEPLRGDRRFQELMAEVRRRWEAFPKIVIAS